MHPRRKRSGKTLEAQLLKVGRDQIWQMIGALITLLGLIWSVSNFYGYPDQATKAVADALMLETSPVVATAPALTPPGDVYVAKWQGSQMSYSDNLLLHQSSCLAPNSFSNSLGSYPAYYVILETWLALTFVNPNELPNGIIELKPIYNDDFEKRWELRAWEVTISKSQDFNTPIDTPIELPPNTPVKIFFRIRHIVDVNPTISATSVYRYVDTNLNPLRMTFETLPPSSNLSFEVSFDNSAGEAVDDGKYNFEFICEAKYSPWPLHMPGRTLGNGEVNTDNN